MQIASRQPMWNEGHKGTEVDLVFTSSTGKSLTIIFGWYKNRPVFVDWGDGSKQTVAPTASEGSVRLTHTYPAFGEYRLRVEEERTLAFRELDGQHGILGCEAAVISVEDYAGTLTRLDSGAWQGAYNLERFVAPASNWMGQRTFSNCKKLKEVVLGKIGIHFDGSFQNCTSLENYSTITTGTCWSYVWQGCTKIRELRLGSVSQFATQDFQNTPNLMDIWIDNKTVEQIKQVAAEGNIIAGYSARFPWNANANCRFHGTNGIVLGNGTIIHE